MSMLDEITPVLLSYNEAPNIARTLSHLKWASDIVVLDSGSTDETLSILANSPRVRVLIRPFDIHSNQWRHAVFETGISTPWILRLDADYQVTDELVKELSRLDPNAPFNAYRIGFDYAIYSRKLVSSFYPPNTILLRMGHFAITQRGHTEAWSVEGPIGKLRACIVHDDRKPTESWLKAQSYYMRQELAELPGRQFGIRKILRLIPPVMPIIVFLYCLFGKGLILNGKAGIFYALQRLIAEATLSLMVLEKTLCQKGDEDRNDNR
jgi:glycosyltransferase involved in cell wall biosynthesis